MKIRRVSCSSWCTAAMACIAIRSHRRVDLDGSPIARSQRIAFVRVTTSASMPDAVCSAATIPARPGWSRKSLVLGIDAAGDRARGEQRALDRRRSVQPGRSVREPPPRCPQRASRSPAVTGPQASASTVARRLPAVAAVIMPAATVPLVSGSIRMNAPVPRFSA